MNSKIFFAKNDTLNIKNLDFFPIKIVSSELQNDFAQKLKKAEEEKKVFELKPDPISYSNSLTIFVFGEMDRNISKCETFYVKICTFVKKKSESSEMFRKNSDYLKM